MTRIIREYILPCHEEAGLLWVHGVHGKVGENPEVVRCRECRRFIENATPHDDDHKHFCTKHGIDEVVPDGYCKWGEKHG